MLKPTFLAIVLVLTGVSWVGAQTSPSPTVDQWIKDAETSTLESLPCKEVTWLLQAESVRPPRERQIRYALGWWGRGFVEGGAYILGDKALKAVGEFGLSVDVVAAHVATYCHDHPAETPFDAIQHLLLKVMK